MITTVIAVVTILHQHKHFSLIHCGREKDVKQQISAALTVACRGFVRPYQSLQLMILKYATVTIHPQLMKTLLYH